MEERHSKILDLVKRTLIERERERENDHVRRPLFFLGLAVSRALAHNQNETRTHTHTSAPHIHITNVVLSSQHGLRIRELRPHDARQLRRHTLRRAADAQGLDVPLDVA